MTLKAKAREHKVRGNVFALCPKFSTGEGSIWASRGRVLPGTLHNISLHYVEKEACHYVLATAIP